MLFSNINHHPGEVTSISLEADYIEDPLALFAQLSQSTQNNMLLESADVSSKDNLKSILLIDSALRISCNAQQVTLDALSENGMSLLPFLQHQANHLHTDKVTSHLEGKTLTLTFANTLTKYDEDSRLKATNSFDGIRTLLNSISANNEQPFAVFLGGIFAYDMIANFESLPNVSSHENNCPDYVFYLAETLFVIDHKLKTTQLIGNVFSGQDAIANCFAIGRRLEMLQQTVQSTIPPLTRNAIPATNGDITVDISDDAFCLQVQKLKQHIVEGDVFQVVPSRTFTLDCPDSLYAYQVLKEQNPSPYMFYVNDSDFTLFGASPESALKYCATHNTVEVYPIAGTRGRGRNADGSINLDLDCRIELSLRNDEKEKAEHMMLVDLARNDVAKISKSGTRFVKDLLQVDRYSHVMHLVSRVQGQLREDLDALHAYQACMNMGTLVGAPKVKAAELIRHTEQKRRGSYGGAVGYLTGQGEMDTCIVIRSAFVRNGKAHIQAGAGVVFDSVPQAEADETRKKAQAVITAIQTANTQSQNKS
ncbi:anthranilate synthase component 1 [Flocculibacter collagenilyticus]|uniref:anthranilate synthase component 1 n=1 Tax=Flocculibacter collagenilyticus TaxID=2744479 RepID=UPI0018F66701|nr:anthranilate synthase component 1 [Flocculibacter collagenilyticus]